MDIRERLRDVAEIPALPDSVLAVLRAIKDPSISAKDITDMISCDVAISSKLLRIANSAYYGFRGNISSITQAIVMLGFGAVKNLVLSFSIHGLLSSVKDSEYFSVKEFWKHCVSVAVAARVVAEDLGLRNSEDFFTQGLLHDVGKLVMCKLMPGEFSDVIRYSNINQVPFCDAEVRIVDYSHTVLAYELFSMWKMPNSLVEAAAYHHDMDLVKSHKNVLIIALADFLVKQMGLGNSGDNNMVPDDGILLELAKLNGDSLTLLKERTIKNVEGAKIFLEFLEGE